MLSRSQVIPPNDDLVRVTRHSEKGILEGWASGTISTDIRPCVGLPSNRRPLGDWAVSVQSLKNGVTAEVDFGVARLRHF
jgi:hypothetical protein